MTDLEELVRATLADRADDAPTPDRLVDSVRARRHRMRRSRQALAVVAVAAATAAAVVIPLTLTASPHQTNKHVDAPPKPPTEQVIGFHGIEITVPASWKMNATRCGTPVADTVIRDSGGNPLCLLARPPKVSSVELTADVMGTAKLILHTSQYQNPHGVNFSRGPVGHGIGAIAPGVGVVLFIDANPALTQQILDSVRPVATDTTGCKMHERRLNPPFSSASVRGPAPPFVISPAATSIAVCHYQDNWLVSSAVATGTELANLVHQANSARRGFAHARPADYSRDICTNLSSRGGEAGSGYILLAHLADGRTQQLWAHIGSCGPLGITNGLRAGALNLRLAQAIAAPLHSGFTMAGRLLPGAR